MKNWKAEFNARLEEMKKEESIICPWCGTSEQNVDDLPDNLITYWGEDEPQKVNCLECGKEYYVQEIVRRTFVEAKKFNKYGEVIESD